MFRKLLRKLVTPDFQRIEELLQMEQELKSTLKVLKDDNCRDYAVSREDADKYGISRGSILSAIIAKLQKD